MRAQLIEFTAARFSRSASAASEKSAYDPCPYGWCVAPSAAFAGLEIVGTPAAGDEEKFGWTLTDGSAESLFMGAGRRIYPDGRFQNIYVNLDSEC